MVPPPQDLTEEALLGPQGAPGVPSDQEMDAEEQSGSACQVSYSKEMDRLTRLAQRYATAIGVECESVLSKHFRSSDPVRDQISEAVRTQTRLAWESIKNVFEQARLEVHEGIVSGTQGVEEDVLDILRVAKLTTTKQLKQCLDNKLKVDRQLAGMCSRLQCDSVEALEYKIEELSETLKDKELRVSQLQEKVKEQQFQLKELVDKVALMGTEVAVDRIPRGEPAIISVDRWRRFEDVGVNVTESLQHNRHNWTTTIQGFSSLSPQQGSATTRDMARRTSGIGESYPSSAGVNGREECESALVEYLKTSSLPAVKPFSGREKESFNRFISAFVVKYPRRLWDDKSLVQLLGALLRKDALTIFETLPQEVRSGPFDTVVEAMKERLREDDNNARIRALAALRKLTIREDQSVGEFCLAVEKLASKAYPNSPPEVTSLQKAEILFNQLAGWEGSYNLSEALELADASEAYERVKDAALRLERTRKTAKETSQKPLYGKRSAWKAERFKSTRPLATRNEGAVEKRDSTLPRQEDKSRTSAVDQSVRRPSSVKEDVKCFKCGKKGHVARRCTAPKESAESAATSRVATVELEERESFATMLKQFWCTSTHIAVVERTRGLFGEKSLYPAEVMGLKVKALLDTGSETSIAPLSVFKLAKNKEVDIDKFVKRIPGVEAVVCNASGEPMHFLDTIKMDVSIDGETHPIAFQVAKGPDDFLVLGTNALSIFGIQLGKVKPHEQLDARQSDQDTIHEPVYGKPLHGPTAGLQPVVEKEGSDYDSPRSETNKEANVQKREFLPPRCVKFVPLKASGRSREAVVEPRSPALPHSVCRVAVTDQVELPAASTVTEPTTLKKVPPKIDDVPTKVKSIRVKRGRERHEDHANQIVSAICRSQFSDNGRVVDNSALSLFHTCSGRRFEADEKEEYSCTIRQMTFGSVAHVDDAVISNLRFSSVFELARLISIFESEPDLDRKRFKMRNPSIVSITVSGVEKAYVFFKRFCDHMIRALMVHDGGHVAVSSNNGVDIDITQVNELTNAGIRFAQGHTWDDVTVCCAKKSTIIFMPHGFRGFDRVAALKDNVVVSIYSALADVCDALRNKSSIGTCIFVTPTSDEAVDESQWMRFSSVLAAVARDGIKLIAVCGPQGERGWQQNRQKAAEAFSFVREAAAAMKHNVVTMFGHVPEFAEPFTVMGAVPRTSSREPYPLVLVKEFFKKLQEYVAGHTHNCYSICTTSRSTELKLISFEKGHKEAEGLLLLRMQYRGITWTCYRETHVERIARVTDSTRTEQPRGLRTREDMIEDTVDRVVRIVVTEAGPTSSSGIRGKHPEFF
ncbi:unnamed protein product [Heligmosomoides polygyrus]|uniref:CCHC-type domain-containing protein n=1 Tax=Heligmosomoides polygyrus TaxID=6339 RepID=A0A183GSI9_HELPZ|nr:unnamed protein product [Heligmosomoides polygyrus]